MRGLCSVCGWNRKTVSGLVVLMMEGDKEKRGGEVRAKLDLPWALNLWQAVCVCVCVATKRVGRVRVG